MGQRTKGRQFTRAVKVVQEDVQDQLKFFSLQGPFFNVKQDEGETLDEYCKISGHREIMRVHLDNTRGKSYHVYFAATINTKKLEINLSKGQ